jgi:5'-nucleotidase
MPTSRRKFILNTALATTGLLLAKPLQMVAEATLDRSLTLLHTNDVHSRLDPFPMDGSKYQGLGGAVAREKLVQQIRQEVQHTLLLDAGDMFQGTPYFNYFNGEPEIEIMNKLGYDAGTLGNHDFDNGVVALATQLERAQFPIVNCNYELAGTVLADKIVPYHIIRQGKIKVGILGVGIELNGLVPEKNYRGIEYTNPITAAQETADKLKKQHRCDYVICLSHLGFKYDTSKISDVVLAKETQHIDCILGGHTHTFLEELHRVKNRQNQEVIINQVGWAGINLGRIDIFFSHNKRPNYTSDLTTIEIGKREI